MLTRSRSKSVDTTCSDESSSQGSLGLTRELSAASSSSTFVDSQDSAPPSLVPERETRKPSNKKKPAHHLPSSHSGKSSQWVVIFPRKGINHTVSVLCPTPIKCCNQNFSGANAIYKRETCILGGVWA